jgi:hypothetical protein
MLNLQIHAFTLELGVVPNNIFFNFNFNHMGMQRRTALTGHRGKSTTKEKCGENVLLNNKYRVTIKLSI